MGDLDTVWADVSAVFGLGPLFGQATPPLGSEIPSALSQASLVFLQADIEMAEFVEDFVMDSYNIILREEVVPQFWSHFSSPTADTRAGFEAVCVAVRQLAGEVARLVVRAEELQRLRDRCNTHRTLWGQRTVRDLLLASLRGTMHSQLDSVKADWRVLVTQFYTRSFTVSAGRAWRAGLLDRADGGPEDSGDWGQDGDLTCSGCQAQTENCQCEIVTEAFQRASSQLRELGLVERLSDCTVLEILQDRITAHVQETCRGSFDCSYLSSLEEWLDSVVVAWLAETCIGGITRKRLQDHLYTTYTRARIEQLFNIIIEWPDSQPALEDVRLCLASQPELRSHLTASLKAVLDSKLLHPGVNTADILTAYIAAIRALTVLDGSGVVLQLVCEDVRKYLKTREDTVRCIVQSLIDEQATELAEELQKTEGLHLDHSFQSPEEDCLEDWENWQPDPVDAPSKHRGRRSADIISMLVNIYGSKELFVNEYRSLLSNRLLTHCSYDTDREIRHLELLKLRFGEVPLHQCEVMLKDIGDSKRINTQLHNPDGGSDELQVAAFPVNSVILSAQFWPQLRNETLKLPQEVIQAMEVYTKAYQACKPNRTLEWKPHLGFANIDLEIGDKKLNLTVSPIQAAIIHRFQERTNWTAAQLSASLEVPLSTLRRKIAFWVGQGLLVETAQDQFCLAAEDSQLGRRSGLCELQPGPAMEEEQEDSVTASSADQREEELGVFWNYIVGMLTNMESLPLDRIHQMLRIFAVQGPSSSVECDQEELRGFLDSKVRQHKLAFSAGQYRLPPPAK